MKAQEEWQRLQDLFELALKTHESQREAMLDASGADIELKTRILRMVEGVEHDASAAADAPAYDGRRLGAYTLLQLIETGGMGAGGDLLGLGFGAVIAPEIVLVERFKILADGDDAGAGCVKRNGGDAFAGYAGSFQHRAGGANQSPHLVVVGLGSEVWIFAPAMERILS